MTETIKENLKDLYDSHIKTIYNIYTIFKDYFGEDRVDLQGVRTWEEYFNFVSNLPLSSLPYICSELDMNERIVMENILFKDLPEIIQQYYIDQKYMLHYYVAINRLPSILVYFPEVTVTNENDKSEVIWDIYARIQIKENGGITKFTINRTTYSLAQLNSNYLHSHVPEIPFSKPTSFQTPCTGSGPINLTFNTLSEGFNEDILTLFCHELDEYMKVESIKGGPYNRLENIHNDTENKTYDYSDYIVYQTSLRCEDDTLSEKIFNTFIKYFIQNTDLHFKYHNGTYTLAYSPLQWGILVTNKFIDWYNSEYKEKDKKKRAEKILEAKVLKEVVIKDNNVYYKSSCNRSSYTDRIHNYENQAALLFKNEIKRIKIIQSEETKTHFNLLLEPDFCRYLFSKIIYLVNANYGKCNSSDNSKKRRFYI